jgi:hypothetical protein
MSCTDYPYYTDIHVFMPYQK